MGYVLGAAADAAAASSTKAFGVLAKANADLAKILVPLHPAIDHMPFPATERFKQMLKEKPIDALVEWITPWEDIAKDTLTLANQLSGRPVRVIGLPPYRVQVDMRWEWPDDALVTDYSQRVFLQRLRTANNLMIMFVIDPGHLSVAFAKTMARYVKQELQRAGAELVAAGKATAEQVSKAAQEAANRAEAAAKQVSQGLPPPPVPPPSLPGLPSLWGLGGLAGGPAAAGGAGAVGGSAAAEVAPVAMDTGDKTAKAAGAASTPPIALAIIGLLQALIPAGSSMASSAAPVAVAAIKASSAQQQKNPYDANTQKSAQAAAEQAKMAAMMSMQSQADAKAAIARVSGGSSTPMLLAAAALVGAGVWWATRKK